MSLIKILQDQVFFGKIGADNFLNIFSKCFQNILISTLYRPGLNLKKAIKITHIMPHKYLYNLKHLDLSASRINNILLHTVKTPDCYNVIFYSYSFCHWFKNFCFTSFPIFHLWVWKLTISFFIFSQNNKAFLHFSKMNLNIILYNNWASFNIWKIIILWSC